MSDTEEYKFPFDSNVEQYAREVLNECPETRVQCLADIREWLAANPQINGRTETVAILPFLRGCKFDVERTKTKLRNYYMMRAEVPQWFRNRDPSLPELQELIKLGVFVPLRQLYENKLVVVIRTGVHDPQQHQQDDVFKAGKMMLDVATKCHEIVQIYGVITIFDMQNVGWRHARQLPPAMIKRAVHAWQNYHSRAKQLEFINAPGYINVVLDIFKKFMSAKLQGRVRVHYATNGGGLGEIVGKEVLPVEYGGEDGDLNSHIEYWNAKLLEYKEWFKDDEQYKAIILS